MNKIKRIVSLVLVLCMVMAFLPVGIHAAEDDYAYSIVHVDAGRKYFTPDELKSIIDNAADAGFNQVELYLSDNQGFRFALDDMSLTTAYGTYDLTPALGDGYSDSTGKAPDGTGKYLTQAEMDDIIAYANGKGIDIVPCINVPGHMGAILEAFTGFRYKQGYSSSKSSIALDNEEAVAFALGLTEKYAAYFASRGCKFYNVGADEYANDLSKMGFEGMGATLYTKFVQFLNDAADIILDLGMTPRAFNDGFYYRDYSISVEPNKAYEVCYWSSGWSGYEVGYASTIAAKGHKMINTDGGYYWVLGNSDWQCSASKASGFDYTNFSGGETVSNPAGAMFCIWSDTGNADSGANVVSKTASVIAAFGKALPQVDSLVTGETPDPSIPTEPEQEVALTDDATGIILAAPGLTGLTVTEADAPAIEGATNALAWDMVPETAEGPYTGAAEVSVPVPADWHVAWLGAFVVNADGTVEKLEGSYFNGMYTYTCPHFSVTGIYEAVPTAEGEEPDEPVELEERSITVNVGGTATDLITGGQYTADKTDLSEAIATVTTKGETIPGEIVISLGDQITLGTTNNWSGKGIIKSGNYYMTLSGNTLGVTTDVSQATEFTVTRTGNDQYSISSGSYYVRYSSSRVSASTTSYSWYYSSSNGFYRTSSGRNYYLTAGSSSWSASSTSTSSANRTYLYDKVETVTESVDQTTVTFRGVAVGVTYVTVGNVRYTINVVDKAPDNALTSSSVTLEYWITNVKVTANNANSMTISSNMEGVRTAEGVALKELAPAAGIGSGNNEVLYWKSVRLDSANKQTTEANDDETNSGSQMTHIRYHNGAWQYRTADGSWNYFVSGDQLVAYYMQTIDVTEQIVTLSKDWGYIPSENTDSPSAGQVALSFAVVDAGTLTPTEENIFAQSTMIFNYWSGRDIGVVAPLSNPNYEVYKITVTEGKRSGSTSNNWKTGAPTWEKTTNDLGTGEWFDEREIWNIAEGTAPEAHGVNDNIVWPAKNTAFLLLFYVRAKNADLTVRYVDDSLAGATITERGVFASGGENFFDLEQSSPVPNTDGSFTLDDNATLTYFNYETEKNIVQTFEKSLLNFQDIQPQYRSGAYEYVGAEIADDGKTLILHYNINDKVLKPRFVVDFGLSVSVPLTDIVANYGTSDVSDVRVMNAAYGTAAIKNGVLTYTPNAVLQSAAAVTLRVSNSNGTTTIFNVGFVPASTVYYEEGFAAFNGSWTGGSTGSGEQALQDSLDGTANYGYDDKYANETGKSGGTEAVSTTSGDKAELTFTGTGIDVYANCDTTTSVMIAMLYDADGKMVKMYQVDTKAKVGTSGITGGQAVESMSLPVVSIKVEKYGTYRLVLQHTKAPDASGSIRLDGFRVYNTLSAEAASADYPTAERNPSFLEVRNSVLAGLYVNEQPQSDLYTYVNTLMSQVYEKEGSLTGSLVLGDVTMDAQDLLENGPKNELFLYPGQSVTFNVGSAKVQLGMKAPMGETKYEISGITSGTIKTGTDMFYANAKMTGNITIRNTGDKILSVTKLKLFGGTGLQELTADDVAYALYAMGLTEQQVARPGAPIANPFADVAEDSFYYDAVLWAVGNGITTGADETHFLPDAICQRASVVTFLWRAAGSPEPETTVNPFVDVHEGEYYYDAVLWALENGITTGIDGTHFAPFGNCSRAQVVTFLWRANGSPVAGGTAPFADVAEGQWYTDAVLWAVENGITNGMSATVFGVENTCNRAQIVTFLYRASK